jgi:hypothetical protein
MYRFASIDSCISSGGFVTWMKAWLETESFAKKFEK